MSKISNKFIVSLLEWIISFCIVINFRTVYTSINISEILSKSFFGIIVISLITIIILSEKESLKIKQIEKFILYFGFMLLYLVIQPNSRLSYIELFSIFIMFIFTGIIVKRNVLKRILLKYSNIIAIIASISLFFWAFGSILKIIPSSGSVVTAFSGGLPAVNYYYIYFETQLSSLSGILSKLVIRNSAIYVEAPMAAMNFSIAFSALLLLDDRKHMRKIYTLGVAIVSTLSMTGYIYLVGVLAFYYFIGSKKVNKLTKFSLLPIIITVIGVLVNYLVSAKIGALSGNLRTNDFNILADTWNIHPWIGSGLDNNEVLLAAMPYWRIVSNLTGLSNSITPLWIYGGLYLTVLYAVPIIVGIYDSTIRKDSRMLIFILGFIYLFVFTISLDRYLVLLCLSMFFTGKENLE